MSNPYFEKQKIKDFDRFSFKNNTIYQLLTYGDQAPGDISPRLPISNWNVWSLGTRGILTWLLTEALSLRRWPWHPDYTQQTTPSDIERPNALSTLEKYFGNATQIESAAEELRRMYDHTQRYFKAQGIKTVVLHRSFGDQADLNHRYASWLVSCFKAAQQLERPSFSVPAHILSSWCVGAAYSTYPVTIRVEHPVEDVLCFSELLESKERPDKPALESGEWIIINRALDGCLTLPTNALVNCKFSEDWKPSFGVGKDTDNKSAEKLLEAARTKMEPFTGFIKPLFDLEPKSRIGLKARFLRAYKVFQEKEA